MEPRPLTEDHPTDEERRDDGIVAFGDEHDRGVETLCVGEAA